jgi:hypothetical protein
MNSEQLKDEIRKLNCCERIGLYRWINEEIAGRPGIGADRSLQIRKEIERVCKAVHPKSILLSAESANPSSTLNPSTETRCRFVENDQGGSADEPVSSIRRNAFNGARAFRSLLK